MKLCMRQQVFSWTDRFTVWDEFGNDRYAVEGELLSWGKKLHVYDADGREVAFIKQEVFSLMPRFCVFVDGSQIAEIVKRFTLLCQRYEVQGLDWGVDGNFLSHDYMIHRDGYQVATVHKQWLTWGDCYTMDIADERDELAALAVALAIDCVIAQSDHANS